MNVLLYFWDYKGNPKYRNYKYICTVCALYKSIADIPFVMYTIVTPRFSG